MTLVIKDVPHFTTVMGNPAAAMGLNVEGLKRRGVSAEVIRHLRDAYKVVYRDGLTVDEACAKLAGLAAEVPIVY